MKRPPGAQPPPPEELLVRLKEGKVYIPEQAARAIRDFFRQGNLTALREMALRRAAERVDDQMRAYMQTRAIQGPWPAAERLLVCISPNPLAEKLVRTARRLADELNSEWFAVYVELASKPELDPAKDVKGNVLDGVREVQTLIDQYNAVMARWSDPDADYEAIGAEQSTLEDRIAAADAWSRA